MKLEGALEKLVALLREWGLKGSDWCLVGEWALVLQGYNLKGRKGIIDIYVNRVSLPWKVKKERQVIPPRSSRYFNEWVSFTEQTGFGLDMIPIPENPTDTRTAASIRRNSIVYQLPNGSNLRVNTPLAEVRIHQWLFQQYTEEDVGEENIKRWWEYIRDIAKAAQEKRDGRVIEATRLLLRRYGKRSQNS